MISFIVPAHNEAACLARTLVAIHEAARSAGVPYEIVVANDASTDATAEVARQNDARVVSVNHRQISATRNSGAHAAAGERLFFVDADTLVTPRIISAALRAMDRGAAGGGAPALFDKTAPLYARLLIWWLGLFMRLAGISGGAFMFCTREAFHAVGGFDERLFGAEDAAMSWSLKRVGRFAVLWAYVITSGRRMRGIDGLRMVTVLIRMAFFPKMLTRRKSVDIVWYDTNREVGNKVFESVLVQFANIVMLLLTTAFVTGMFWDLLPWSRTPPGTLLGELRIAVAIFNCHIAMVLWPCMVFLFRSLMRQTRWIERLRFAGLIALCLWIVWGATPVVFSFWKSLFEGLLQSG